MTILLVSSGQRVTREIEQGRSSEPGKDHKYSLRTSVVYLICSQNALQDECNMCKTCCDTRSQNIPEYELFCMFGARCISLLCSIDGARTIQNHLC